jgi:hypothetical protein
MHSHPLFALARFVAALAVCATCVRPAFAQDAPSEVPLPEAPKREGRGISSLALTGTLLSGLGGGTLMASGIVWIVAASEASRLDDECPGKRCVEGTTGGDSLERARGAQKAAGILFGIGFPMTTAGLVCFLYTGSLGKKKASVSVAPQVTPRGAGGRLQVTF